jgi:hypothetical protein
MRTLISIAAIFAAGAASAQQQTTTKPLDYSYAELRLIDADNGGDGISIGASFAIDENWIVVAELSDIDYDFGVDTQSLAVGAGYVWHYRPEFDLLATVRYMDLEVDFPSGSADDTGLALMAGARGWVTPQIEWRGTVNYVDVGDNDTFFELGGDYHLNDSIAVGLSLQVGGDNDIFSIGGRWFF